MFSFFVFFMYLSFIFICYADNLALTEKDHHVSTKVLEDNLDYFEKELKTAALDLLDSHAEFDRTLHRSKRSVFKIDENVHHSYIFDILPDKIHDVYFDGANYPVGGMRELFGASQVSHLPILQSDKTKGHLLTVFDGKQISFYSYDAAAQMLKNVSVPITFSSLENRSEGEIVSFLTVSKNMFRLDLDRLLIVQAKTADQHFISMLKIVGTLPSQDVHNPSVHELVSDKIEYEHGEEIVSLSTTSSRSSLLKHNPQYKIWIAVLVRKHNKAIIDVYRIEDFHEWYRYSTLVSYDSRLKSPSKVMIHSILEFIVIFELNDSPNIQVTAFIGRPGPVSHLLHTSIGLPSNVSVTHLETFTYGSRSFVLISTTGDKQYVKEVLSFSGNILKFVEFETITATHGEKWLVIDIPGCREEKLIYLFHATSGVKKIKLFKMDKHGLIAVHVQETCPVYYLAPLASSGMFSYIAEDFTNLEDAREACVADVACIGIKQQEIRKYVLGYLKFIPDNSSEAKVWHKYSATDAADLHCLLRTSDPVYSSLSTFSSYEHAYLIVRLLSGESYIIHLLSHQEIKRRKIVVQNAKIYNKLQDLTEEIDKQELVLNETKEVLIHSVGPNNDQSLWGNYTLDDLSTTHVETRNLTSRNVEWDHSNLTVYDLKIGVDELDRNISDMHRDLEKLLQKLQDVVFVDEDANITGTKWFTGIVNMSSRLEAIDLHINSILNMDVEELLNDTYRRDHPEPIIGKKTFENQVKVIGDTHVGSLNDLDINKDIVTTNTRQTIIGETKFQDPVAIIGDVHADDINGINFGDQAIPLDSNKTIVSPKTFVQTLKANTVNVAEHALVDDIDLSKLSVNVLTINGNQSINGDITFVNDVIINQNVIVDRLSGVNISELDQVTALVNTDVIFTGQKRFSNPVKTDESIFLEGSVNGLKMTNIFTKRRPHTFVTTKHFYYFLTNNLIVDGLISGINFPQDLVTLSTDQVISGLHSFADGITVNGDINLDGTVDEVDISDLRDLCLLIGQNETYIAGNVTFFSNVSIEKYVKVGGFVNGFDLGDCYNDTVFDFEDDVIISAKKTFSYNLRCLDNFVVRGKVNGFNVPDDFIDRSSNQIISGHKVFDDPVFSSNLTIAGLIDDTNITEIENSVVTLSTEQNISSRLKFSSAVHISGNLILSEHQTVDHVDVSEHIVCRHGKAIQNVTGVKKLGHLQVGKFRVLNNVNSYDIDGVNVTQLFKNRVSLSTAQSVPLRWKFGNNTVDHVTLKGRVNGIDFPSWIDDIMSVTKSQTVTARKYFNGLTPEILHRAFLGKRSRLSQASALCRHIRVSCKIAPKGGGYKAFNLDLINQIRFTTFLTNAKTLEGVNGYNLYKVKDDAVKIYNDSIVSGKFNFKEALQINDDVRLTGTVDTVNVTALNLYAVRRQVPHFGSSAPIGDKIFLNGFHVEGNIESSTINGFRVPQETLTVASDQEIHARYEFSTTVEVLSPVHNLMNVTVYDQSDSSKYVTFDLSDFAESTARIDRDETIVGNVVFNCTLDVHGDVTLTGLIDHVDLVDLHNRSVFLNGSQFVQGNLVFSPNSTVVIGGNIDVETLNGLNFSKVLENALRIDQDEVVEVAINFEHLIINNSLKAEKLTAENLINNLVNVTKLAGCAVYLQENETLTGFITFGQMVIVGGYVDVDGYTNDIDFDKDVVTIHTTQNITGLKELDTAYFSKNVAVGGLVNHLYLPTLFEDTLGVSQDQHIIGHKHFKVANFNTLECQKVNGIHTSNYVTLHTNQTITGLLKFLYPAEFTHLYVQGLINHVNITEIEENALFKDENETVRAYLYFEGTSKFTKNVTVAENRTVDGVDLSWLQDEHRKLWIYVEKRLMNLTEGHRRICHETNALQHVLEKSASFLDYMDLPIVSEALPKFSQIVFTDHYMVAVKTNSACKHPDTLIFDVKRAIVNDSKALPWTAGRVVSVKASEGFVLFHKHNDYCSLSPSLYSFIIDANRLYDFVITFPKEIANAINVDMITTEHYIFVSFVFGSKSSEYDIVYRLDKSTNTRTKIIFSNEAKSDEGVLLVVKQSIYYVHVADKISYSCVQFDEIYESSDSARHINVIFMSQVKNILAMTFDDRAYLISYVRTPESAIGHKFLPLPQPASLTLFGVNEKNGNLSLTSHQSLAVDIKYIHVFSVTLGLTTTNYLLVAVNNAVSIYIHHGVSNYELFGIIDLAPMLTPDEIIWTVSSIKHDSLPTIIVQTTIPRTYFYTPVANGWALQDKKLNQCS